MCDGKLGLVPDDARVYVIGEAIRPVLCDVLRSESLTLTSYCYALIVQYCEYVAVFTSWLLLEPSL